MGKSKSDRKTVKYEGAKYKKFVDDIMKDFKGASHSKVIEVCANKGAEFYGKPEHKALFMNDLLQS